MKKDLLKNKQVMIQSIILILTVTLALILGTFVEKGGF